MPLQRPEKNALSFLLECEPGKIVVNKKVLPTFESYTVRVDLGHYLPVNSRLEPSFPQLLLHT